MTPYSNTTGQMPTKLMADGNMYSWNGSSWNQLKNEVPTTAIAKPTELATTNQFQQTPQPNYLARTLGKLNAYENAYKGLR